MIGDEETNIRASRRLSRRSEVMTAVFVNYWTNEETTIYPKHAADCGLLYMKPAEEDIPDTPSM